MTGLGKHSLEIRKHFSFTKGGNELHTLSTAELLLGAKTCQRNHHLGLFITAANPARP